MFKRAGTLWFITAGLLAGLFLLGCGLGVLLPPAVKLMLIEAIMDKFGSILANSSSDGWLAINIFLNNLLVVSIILGSAIIPPVPMMIIFGNGLMIGVFADLLWRLDLLQPGSWLSGMISLVPHGLFELSAVFLAGGFGLVGCAKLVFNGLIQPQHTRKQFLVLTLKWFTATVIPLLLFAAVIETYISPRLAAAILSSQTTTSAQLQTVVINPLALAHTNCVPGAAELDMANAAKQISILYDEPIVQALQQRAQVNQEKMTYTCPDGGWFSIVSYDQTHWSVDQAYQLVRLVLDHLRANYTEPRPLVIDTKLLDTKLRYQILTVGQHTVVITQTMDLPLDPISLTQPGQ